MKMLLTGAVATMILLSCNNANDGDATTDTTNMPMDTAVINSAPGDTAAQFNTQQGPYNRDSSLADTSSSPTTTQSSSGTNPGSRKTTPGNRDTSSRQ